MRGVRGRKGSGIKAFPREFWSSESEELLKQLQTRSGGLTTEEAKDRLSKLGPNLLKPKKRSSSLTLLLAQFKSPIILILIVAASFVVVVCTLVMPFSPIGKLFGFAPLPPFFIIIMLVIVGAYIVSAEILKRTFYQKVKF